MDKKISDFAPPTPIANLTGNELVPMARTSDSSNITITLDTVVDYVSANAPTGNYVISGQVNW